MGQGIHGLSFPVKYFVAYCHVKTVTGKRNIVNNLLVFRLPKSEIRKFNWDKSAVVD